MKDDIEPRKTSREVLTRNYCRSCQAAVSNDRAGDDGKLQMRVRLVSLLLRMPSDIDSLQDAVIQPSQV